MMKRALASLQQMQPARWASVTWAGPGYGSCLELVSRLDSGSCLLLEPHPALGERLVRRATANGIRVDSRALAPEAGPRDFHLMSDPLRSTLLDAKAVMRERPNLRCLGTIQVEALALADLVGGQGFDPDQPNLLILDDTGMEAALLRATGPQAVQAFSHVLVGSSSQAGSSRVHPDGFGDPLHFESDAGQAWLVYVRHRAGVSVDPGAPARARIQELEAQVDSLGNERDELVHECRQSGRQLQQREVEATRLREQLGHKINRIGEFETTVARQQQELARRTEQVGQLEARVAQQQQRLGELDQRLKDAEQGARLAARLQTLREQDLRDLQERYEEARQVQEHQHALLVQVSDRLGTAASHFHALADARGAASEVVVYGDQDGEQAQAKKDDGKNR